MTFSWPSRRHFACFTYLWVIHHSSRRLLSFNVTEHSTSAWTLQQLRDAVRYEQCYRYLIHDRDSIFAKRLDESIARLSMVVLKSPYQSPKANAICERVIGTIRRECLDWVIPLSEAHLRLILKWWVSHYNRGRPHMSLADCDSLGVMKPFRSRSTKQLNNFGVMEPLDSRHMEASALK